MPQSHRSTHWSVTPIYPYSNTPVTIGTCGNLLGTKKKKKKGFWCSIFFYTNFTQGEPMTSRIYAFSPPCNQYGRQMLSNITRENSTAIISGVMHAKGYYNLSPDFRYIYYHILTHILLPLSPISKKPTLKPPRNIFFCQ